MLAVASAPENTAETIVPSPETGEICELRPFVFIDPVKGQGGVVLDEFPVVTNPAEDRKLCGGAIVGEKTRQQMGGNARCRIRHEVGFGGVAVLSRQGILRDVRIPELPQIFSFAEAGKERISGVFHQNRRVFIDGARDLEWTASAA